MSTFLDIWIHWFTILLKIFEHLNCIVIAPIKTHIWACILLLYSTSKLSACLLSDWKLKVPGNDWVGFAMMDPQLRSFACDLLCSKTRLGVYWHMTKQVWIFFYLLPQKERSPHGVAVFKATSVEPLEHAGNCAPELTIWPSLSATLNI